MAVCKFHTGGRQMTELWTDIHMYFSENLGSYLTCLRAHIGISILALLAAAAIGIPFGYVCVKNQKWNCWITGVFQVLRIIPSLAILILLIPVMGTGIKPAMTALVLLAVPPILMNTAAGFEEVPEFMLETAAGLGMTERQIFWKVKVPMAMPMILAGVKTAAIEVIASATIASKIGAGGLGDIILTGLSLNRTDLLLIGGVSVAVVSILAGVFFQQLEKIILKYQYV